MSQYNHEITIHLLRHSSMMQVVSTINDCPGISSSLTRVIGGSNEVDSRLGEKLVQDFRNDFWATQLRLITPNHTPIQEYLHDQSDEFNQQFIADMGEEHPLLAVETPNNLKVVSIDYRYSEPRFSVHSIGSKGMRISSLKGISSIEQALEYAKPFCDVA